MRKGNAPLPERPRWACAGLAVSLAACGTEDDGGGDDGGQAAEEQGGFVPPDIPMAEELGERRGLARRCSPGRATPRTAAPTSRSTG